jgi:hypothetical protein
MRPTTRIPLAVLLVGALAVLSGCGKGTDDAARNRCEATAGVGKCVERGGKWLAIGSVDGTTSTSTAPTPTTEPATTTTASTTTTTQSTTTTLGSSPTKIAVPSVVGKDLQTAQDTMQAAGLYNLTSHDSTGQGRFQILDRNWRVTDQTPAAGRMVDEYQQIDLGAMKFTD